VPGDLLDSVSFMDALETANHTCVRDRVLADVHQRLKPAPAALDVAQPGPRARRLSPRQPLPLQPVRDDDVYQFDEAEEPSQPAGGSSRNRQNVKPIPRIHRITHTHTRKRIAALVRDYPGEPVPEDTFTR